MKEVTIDNVRERIKAIASRGNTEYGIGLTLKEEFELACLRQLAAVMEQKPYGYAELYDFPRTTATLYPEQDRYATMPLYAAPPAPVSVPDADPSLNAMMRALDAFYADDDVPERAMLSAFRILLADVRNQVRQEPAADNTATADELRAQGVDIMKAKTLQCMQRSRSSFDAETWAVAEQCLLGLVDGCEVVANELRTGKLPERFRPQPDDTAPQQFEALATSAGSGKQ